MPNPDGIWLTFVERRQIITARGDRPQAEIARRAGISRVMLTRIESGDVGVSVDVLRRLCRALNLKLEINIR